MKKLKVGFEFSLVTPEHGGIFQYSFYILRLLKEIDEIETIFLFCKDAQSNYFDEFRTHEKFKLIEVKPYRIIKKQLRKISDYILNRYIFRYDKNKSLFKLYHWFNPDTTYFNRFNLDVIHTPWHISRVFSIKAPVIVTIHDLVQLRYPEFFGPLERLHRSVTFTKSILLSDQVISSFEHVKMDVQKYFLVEENKTSVCPVPLASEGFVAKTFTSIEKLTDIYNIPEEFVLTPAASWPHKNHIGMLNALKILKDRGREVYWIATGPTQDYFHKVIEPKIKELGLSNQVQFTGIVSQEDLIGFYKTTKLVVMPTLYEAGSGPLFESMRFGVPVICSNVTSLPNSIEKIDFIFDPNNHDQIADMIERGLNDEDFRKSNINNSKQRIDFFANFDYKQPIIDAYSKAISYKQSK